MAERSHTPVRNIKTSNPLLKNPRIGAKFKPVYQGFNFVARFALGESVQDAYFSKVSGLGEELDVIEYRESNALTGFEKLPGLSKANNVVFERGISASLDLSEWFSVFSNSTIVSKHYKDLEKPTAGKETSWIYNGELISIYIYLLNRDGKKIQAQFYLEKAFPVKWSIGDFDAQSGEVVIETLEVACSAIYREK